MTVMDAMVHRAQMMERYRRCFEWYQFLSTELREWVPEDDILHMEMELRAFGLPLPGEEGAHEQIVEAAEIFDQWTEARARLMVDAASSVYAMAQNCPYC